MPASTTASADSEAPGVAGGEVYVVGGANSAGQAALHLARFARACHARDPRRRARRRHVAVSRAVRWRRRRTSRCASAPRWSTAAAWVGSSTWCSGTARAAREESVLADGLFLMIGAKPHTEWLPPDIARDEQGFIVTGLDLARGRPTERPRLPFETSMPGVLAAGDVRQGLGEARRVGRGRGLGRDPDAAPAVRGGAPDPTRPPRAGRRRRTDLTGARLRDQGDRGDDPRPRRRCVVLPGPGRDPRLVHDRQRAVVVHRRADGRRRRAAAPPGEAHARRAVA